MYYERLQSAKWGIRRIVEGLDWGGLGARSQFLFGRLV